MHIANCKNRSIHVNYCEHSQTPCIAFNQISIKNCFSSSKNISYSHQPAICMCFVCVQAVMSSDFNEWGSAKQSFIHQLFSNFKERLALRCETLVNCGRELIAMPSMWYLSHSSRGKVCRSSCHPPYKRSATLHAVMSWDTAQHVCSCLIAKVLHKWTQKKIFWRMF